MILWAWAKKTPIRFELNIRSVTVRDAMMEARTEVEIGWYHWSIKIRCTQRKHSLNLLLLNQCQSIMCGFDSKFAQPGSSSKPKQNKQKLNIWQETVRGQLLVRRHPASWRLIICLLGLWFELLCLKSLRLSCHARIVWRIEQLRLSEMMWSWLTDWDCICMHANQANLLFVSAVSGFCLCSKTIWLDFDQSSVSY